MSICVAIASANPVKKRATLEAVRVALGIKDVDAAVVEVDHGMPDQPFGDEETLRGARTRAEGARAARPDADYWVGLEGGVTERDGELEAMAWAVVLGRTAGGELRRGESRTATFTLPREIADLVRSGVELGEATDRVYGESDTKRGPGTVSPLTGGIIDRVSYYAHAMVLALVPFRNPEFTFTATPEAVEV